MKIAFVGKGGSGKTTVTALFARWVAAQGKPVVAYDGDVNQHLLQALNASLSQYSTLTSRLHDIKEYLRGTNARITNSQTMTKTTPPGEGSRLLAGDPSQDPFLQTILHNIHGVWAAAVGEIEQNDLGVACFHGKSGVIELLLGHTLDAAHQYICVDLTAGIDPLASSVLAKVDAMCLIVEPSLPSLTVYEQFLRHKKEDWLPPLFVIGNKVSDVSDAEWLKQKIGSDMIASLPTLQYVKRQARGEQLPIDQVEPEVHQAFTALLADINSLTRDWQAYRDRSILLHRKNALSWANERFGADIQDQIDPSFTYPAVDLPRDNVVP